MKKIFLYRLLIKTFILVLVFTPCSFSQENIKKGLELNGSSYFDTTLYQYKDGDVKYAGANVGAFRLRNADRRFVRFESSFDISLNYGNKNIYALTDGMLPPFGHNVILANNVAALSFNLKTMYISLFTEYADINLGRQIVRFGTGTFFSPVNTFSFVDVSAVNVSGSQSGGFERFGSDAADIVIPFGITSGMELVTTFSSDMDKTVSAIKLYANLLGFDMALYGMYRTGVDQAVVGLSFKGDLVVGLHGEVVGNIHTDKNKMEDSYIQVMAGIDYSFFNRKLMMLLEYQYSSDAIELGVLVSPAVALLRPFMGEHYMFLQLAFTPIDIISISGNALWNILDKGYSFTLAFNWNLIQSANMTLYTRYSNDKLNLAQTSAASFDVPILEYALRFEVFF